MKLTEKQISRMVHLILDELKSQGIMNIKGKESELQAAGVAIVKSNMAEEMALEEQVHRMMDDLERQHPGEFQRYKMFPLLKKKLAKEKGVIL